MEIMIQQELKEACLLKKHWPNDILEAYIEYASLYSKECWLSLQDEYLRRMELEIAIY